MPQRNYLYPETGLHTQAIERAWTDANVVIKRNVGGLKGNTRQEKSHLDECSWQKSSAESYTCALNLFLKDAALVFGSTVESTKSPIFIAKASGHATG